MQWASVSYLFNFVVFCFCFVCHRPVSSMPNVASASGLSILGCPFGMPYSLLYTQSHRARTSRYSENYNIQTRSRWHVTNMIDIGHWMYIDISLKYIFMKTGLSAIIHIDLHSVLKSWKLPIRPGFSWLLWTMSIDVKQMYWLNRGQIAYID